MKDYKVILFDLDDTLIDNIENIKIGFKNTVKHFGINFSDELFEQWKAFDKNYWIDFANKKINVPKNYLKPQSLFVKYVRGLRFSQFFDISIDDGIVFNEYYIEMLKENVISIDGAYDTLKYLNEKYILAVATNGPSDAINAKLSKIGCKDFVKFAFSSDMTKNTVTKPNLLYFDELLDYINFHDRTKILIVGDELNNDIFGGLNAGIDTCWFNRLNEKSPENIKPTFTIYKLKELKNIL